MLYEFIRNSVLILSFDLISFNVVHKNRLVKVVIKVRIVDIIPEVLDPLRS